MAEYADQESAYAPPLSPKPYASQLRNSVATDLDEEEIAHFKREGFLVKRGLVQADAEFERLIDYVWETVPEGVLSRNDPSTWMDGPQHRWPAEAVPRVGALHRGNWKMRSPTKYGREAFVLSVTANHPRVRGVVERFIGSSIRGNSRVRGVYVVLPKPVEVQGQLGPHVDHAAAQICAMVFVGKTPPRSGGFTIWPRSHTRLHPYWQTCLGAHFNPELKDKFNAEHRTILQTTTPIEFVGNPGDVVFWHPRLIHSAGVNYSAATGEPLIRYIVPCDFQKDGYTYFDDDVLGPGPKHQWWVDTRHFKEDPPPTSNNMWDDWAI